MMCKLAIPLALAAVALPARAWAADDSPAPSTAAVDRRTAVEAEVAEALESQATLPAVRPSLPDQASGRAQEVQSTLAFGQKGSAERAAHRAAEAARSDSATAAARKAAEAAADRAGQKSQAAATERRAEEVRQGLPPSKPLRGKPL